MNLLINSLPLAYIGPDIGLPFMSAWGAIMAVLMAALGLIFAPIKIFWKGFKKGNRTALLVLIAINVLRSEMSLIGPRPPLPAEVEKYEFWQRRRLSMRPGITGYWQVSGRNKVKRFEDWMKLDLEYIDRWSLYLDMKILFKTIPAVLSGAGAK